MVAATERWRYPAVEYMVTCQQCGTDVPFREARVEVKGRDVEVEFDCPNPNCREHNLYCE